MAAPPSGRPTRVAARCQEALLDPKECELELDGVEGFGSNHGVFSEGLDDSIGRSIQPKHLEGLRIGVDEPQMRDVLSRVHFALRASIQSRCRGREHLADPVRSELEERAPWCLRHALPPKASDVRHEDVAPKMQLGLVDDEPSSWSSATSAKPLPQITPELRGRDRMRDRLTGMRVECSAHDLADLVLGQAEEVFVAGLLRSGASAHLRIVAPRSPDVGAVALHDAVVAVLRLVGDPCPIVDGTCTVMRPRKLLSRETPSP